MGNTVAAKYVLAVGIGEIIGGSQREQRLEVLDERMAELGLSGQLGGIEIYGATVACPCPMPVLAWALSGY